MSWDKMLFIICVGCLLIWVSANLLFSKNEPAFMGSQFNWGKMYSSNELSLDTAVSICDELGGQRQLDMDKFNCYLPEINKKVS